MSSWQSDDFFSDKPVFPALRQVRPAINANTGLPTVLTVASTVIATGNGNSAITFVGANSAINAGITAGMFVYDTSLYNTVSVFTDDQGNSEYAHVDFFASNNTVLSVTNGNVVTLVANVVNTVLAGNVIAFGTAINYGLSAGANTYNQDTILITPTRSANNTTMTGAIANVGNLNVGWNHIQKKVNNDGTVRYLKETLVCLANPTSSNTNSGNTSFGQFVSGL